MQDEGNFPEEERRSSGRFGSINSLKRETLAMMNLQLLGRGRGRGGVIHSHEWNQEKSVIEHAEKT